jgi:hypothetical protein
MLVVIACIMVETFYGGTGFYRAHLRKIYATRSISSGGKWPAKHLVKDFIDLAIVSRSNIENSTRDTNEIINYIMPGNIDELYEGKEKVKVEDILKPTIDGSRVSLLLVEGAPGIGKSTFAWELCRRWGDIPSFQQFDLVVLHRFRDSYTQQISDVYQLFHHYFGLLQQWVTYEVMFTEGRGVLFILDGFDEFPDNYRSDNFLIKLIVGEYLPEATVIVTSRPSATARFLNHEPPLKKCIEILGFTQEQVKEFASKAFSESKSELEGFLKYINASENPAINTLMYIPLNTVIVVDIYKNNSNRGLPIPETLTELYTQLCLTMLHRYLQEEDPSRVISLSRLTDLSKYGHYAHFQDLSQLAYEEFEKQQVIFYNLADDQVHFDLLDSQKALYGGGRISHNFLHLTIQEFLVAYYISFFSTQEMQVFERYGHVKRWSLVWRFVSGLTKLKYFEDKTNDEVFVAFDKNTVQVHLFFFLCLFEAELKENFDFNSTYEEATQFIFSGLKRADGTILSPMDKYILGHSIVNSAHTVTWNLVFRSGSMETFVWGLKSVRNHRGVISSLDLRFIQTSYLKDFPEEILGGIVTLKLIMSEMDGLPHVLSSMKSLRLLLISMKGFSDSEVDFQIPAVLQSLNNGVPNLTLEHVNISSSHFSTSLKRVANGKVKHLKLVPHDHTCSESKDLFELLFNSSLETLTVVATRHLCKSEDHFSSLKSNNHLANLTIVMAYSIPQFSYLAAALSHNTALQHLTLIVGEHDIFEDWKNLKQVIDVLNSSNIFLKELKISIVCQTSPGCYKGIQRNLDPRVVIGPGYSFKKIY